LLYELFRQQNLGELVPNTNTDKAGLERPAD
ncbi:MAG: hypothetical protein RLZZ574_596, partial [Cyanobacteriota bacterium]